jgi:hypothetical protein
MAKRRAALALAKAKRSAAAAAATEAPEQVDEPPETTAEAPTPTPSTVIPAEARMSKSAIAASEALAEAKRKREAVAAERARLVADAKRRQEAKKADADRAKLEQQQLQKQQEEEQAAAAAELKARREEMERKRREADEEKKRREAEEKRRKEEEEEKKRREDEERRRVALEAAARKRREEEERKKADEERKKAEEAAAAAREAELTLRRKQAEEKRRREEAERKRVADEEAERKRVADEEAERRRIEEEEAAAAAEEEARQLEALAAEEEALLRAEEEQLERERLEAEAEAAMWEQQLSGAAPVPAADDLVPLDSAPRESDVWASVDAVTASGDTDISSLVMPVVPKASAGRESDIWAVINAETAASAAGVLAAAAPEPVDEDWQRELAELDALSNKDLFDMRQSQIQSLIGADNNNKSEPAAAAAGDSQRQLPLSTPYAQLPSKPAQTQSPPKPTPQPQQEKKPTGQYAHLPGDPRPAPAAAGAGPTRQAPTAGRRPMPTPTRRGAPLAPASAPRAAPTPSIDELVDEDDNAELAAAAIKGVDLAQVRTSTAAERQSEMHDLAALDAILNSAVSNSGAMVALDDGLDDEAILALDVDETDEERELRLEVEQLEREERERQATLKRPPQVRPAATTMIAPTKQAPTRLTPTRSVPQLAVQRGPARTAAAATPAPKPAAVVASPPPAEDEFDFDLDSEMLAEAASHASMSVEPKLAPTSYSSAAAAKPANAAPPPSDEDILNELLGEGVDVDEAVSRLTQVLSAPAPTVKSVSDLVREAEEVEEQQRRSLRAAAAAVAADEPPLSPKPVATTSAARPTVSVVTVPASKRTATVSTPPVTSVQLGTTVNKPLAMKGWLSKQAPSGVLKMWKKRYFVLRDDKLLYFDDANLSNTLGVIGLEGASVCATPQGKTGQFQIIAPGRIFHLQAPSEESMESWLKNLRVGCTYAEHRSLSAAESDVPRAKLREGQLLRIAGNKWKETFLVLNGGVLRVLAGDKHGAVVCTIPLYEATFGDFDPNRPPPNLETSTVGMLKSLLGSVSNFDHTFEVVGAQRSVVLKCYNQKDVSEWLSALETHKKSVERTLNTIQ